MLRKNYSLKELNSFGFDVKASLYLDFTETEELITVLKDAPKKILVLGGGSNLVFCQNFDGLILHPQNATFEIVGREKDTVTIKAGAGLEWDEFVALTVDYDLYGVENLSAIPGNVGASPVQNIGAYGVEVKDVIEKIEYLKLSDSTVHTIDKSDCHFAYRDSIFKNELKNEIVILNVYFKLSTLPNTNLSYADLKSYDFGTQTPTSGQVRQAVIQIREHKLPNHKIIGNAGSFFKNPVVNLSIAQEIEKKYDNFRYFETEGKAKLSAAWLVEQIGYKGHIHKSVGVYDKHSLILVNHGGGTGTQIMELSNEIIEAVKTKFGIELEPEPNMIW